MNAMVLFEDVGYANLQPLLGWRSLFELRIGRKIVLDRMAQILGLPVVGVWTRPRMAGVAAQRCGAPANGRLPENTLLVNGRWLPSGPVDFPAAPCAGVVGDDVAFVICDRKLAERLAPEEMLNRERLRGALYGVPRVAATGRLIGYPWDVIANLRDSLKEDWCEPDACIETELDPRVDLEHVDRIHIGQNSQIHPTAVIDASTGPVFISHNVHVGPYCVIEGPAYIGPGSRINPHAWLHDGVATGACCKIGGEIDGCIFHGYTNKQHNGFLGHAYVGSWVNIGAGANNSDLKNTYSSVRVTLENGEVDTEQMFFGAVIGDHAKLCINASLPTGAVVGVAAVVATTRFTPKSVPAFAWLTDEQLSPGKPDLLLDVATRMMVRRNVDMTDAEVELFLELGERQSNCDVC